MNGSSKGPALRGRRDLLAAALAMGLLPAPAAFATARPKFWRRDRFGGCPDLRFKSSGFFRIERGQRSWMVTPEGHGYLSLGINHVQDNLFFREPNRKFWSRHFGTADPGSARFRKGVHHKLRADFRTFGFNALGMHTDALAYPHGFAPFVRSLNFVDIPHWKTPGPEQFLDVFSVAFADHCDRIARNRALPLRDDPFLLGYAFTDCPILTDQDAAARDDNIFGARRPALPTWPRVLRNLSGDHAGKQAYVQVVRRLYADRIDTFNQSYNTQFASFAALAATTAWRPEVDAANPNEVRDNSQFLNEVINRYYRTAIAAIRRYDPNHLILGDKLNGNTDGAEAALPIVGKHADIIYHQTYGFWEDLRPRLDRFAQLAGKPILAGDSTFATPTEMLPNPFGPHCKDQADRARRMLEFATNAFSRPDFIGWHVCGWMDMWKTFPGKEHKQHAGVQTIFGKPHPEVARALSQVSSRMYDLASQGVRRQ